MKSTVFTLCFMFVLAACQSQDQQKKLNPEQWRHDLRIFTEQAPQIHANLYHTLSKAAFDSTAADLDRRLHQLTDEQIRAELIQWVAAIGDGHTHLRPENTRTYPVFLFGFAEGFFVTNGSGGTEKMIGWELTRINQHSVADALVRLKPFQNRDNEHQIRAQAPLYLTTVEALQAAGIVQNPEETVFTFRNPTTGEEKTTRVSPMNREDVHRATQREMSASTALYRQNQDKMYWFTWLPEQKTLYFQYNVTREDPNESIPGFIHKMRAAVEKYPVEKFVVDLRWNHGGNLFTSKPFTEFIARHPKINQRGKLFVLLGRHTFSAASFFTTSLEYRTKAIFVGEPTGASPNHYGDTQLLQLPNSGLTARLSSIYWQNSFPWDRRPATQPDIHVPPTAADWFADRDAALEAIFLYRHPGENPKPAANHQLQQLEGRYFYQGDRLLEIKKTAGKWMLVIPEFIETEIYGSEQDAFLTTDVRSMKIYPAGEKQIRLEAMGGSMLLTKTPDGFRTTRELFFDGKTEEGLAAFRELRASDPAKARISENSLNQLGYDLMNAHKKAAARVVFELNTEFYPEAFNTWDSLAEWYMLEGNKAQAIEHYSKSLSLNPANENGKKMLEKLQH